jgi:hypothetical protein
MKRHRLADLALLLALIAVVTIVALIFLSTQATDIIVNSGHEVLGP